MPPQPQPQPSPWPSALPSDAELDALLQSHDWNGLGAVFKKPTDAESLARGMKWLRDRLLGGAGLMVNIIYGQKLWAIGNQVKVADPQKDLRMSAGLIGLYALEQIIIDGAKCEDQSAPGRRIDQMVTLSYKSTFQFLQQQANGLKLQAIDLALAYEHKTAPLRKDDDLICRGGMEQMRAGLEGGKTHELPPDNHFGKTIAVEPPVGWQPKFRTPEVYLPIQQKAREAMRSTLVKVTNAAE